jgi:homoaconitase/3-isopropylmalate dehydratase large subunit
VKLDETGRVAPNTYIQNLAHRLVTSSGFFRLDDSVEDYLTEQLESERLNMMKEQQQQLQRKGDAAYASELERAATKYADEEMYHHSPPAEDVSRVGGSHHSSETW